jgi:DNA-binding phage protein
MGNHKAVAEYITSALETSDSELLVLPLGDVASSVRVKLTT